MYQPATDLFGEVIILESDIFDWVSAVAPRWLTPERSFRNYVRGYNVVEKIRVAKLTGRYDDIISQRYEPWHARIALSAIL
ncbi:hypothetical protein H8K38_13265 [Undibacterium sp. FT79W]|uniref:hypothetical protein n=1 Tax=Undibacterium sp. FT79W TaxID=2762296 RepID=UPI00164BE320|nr:hypothetical protein [Undibacterium sp. FT79W]MBC3878777.1 hypothetical protein [Undibacterium sp. FT79W]